MAENPDRNYRERVYQFVKKIPRGRVMTYGQLAELLGEGYTPRTVGFVMHGSDDNSVASRGQRSRWLFDWANRHPP